MAKFMCWRDGGTIESAKLIEATTPAAAAERAAEEFGLERSDNMVVSDERARVFAVSVCAREFVTYSAEAPVELSGADVEPDDPMPTPAAEALRDAKFAGGGA